MAKGDRSGSEKRKEPRVVTTARRQKVILAVLAAAVLVGVSLAVFLPRWKLPVKAAVNEVVTLDQEVKPVTMKEWDGVTDKSYRTVSVNAQASRVNGVPYSSLESALDGAREYNMELSDRFFSLNGSDWKFKLYENPEKFSQSSDAAFFKTDYNLSAWSGISVPASWRAQGFGNAAYSNQGTPWEAAGESKKDFPAAPTECNPVGLYKKEFSLPKEWKGKRAYLKFDGFSSAIYVWVNGTLAGYSENAASPAEFDVTKLVKAGEKNQVAVACYSWNDSSYFEQQDRIHYGGLFRDVSLYAADEVRIRDFSVAADLDSGNRDASLQVEATVTNLSGYARKGYHVEMKLFDSQKKELALGKEGRIAVPDLKKEACETTVAGKAAVKNPQKWNADSPTLYTAVLVLLDYNNQPVEYQSCQIGFRKIRYKKNDSGWYEGGGRSTAITLNGQPLKLKGVVWKEGSAVNADAVTREEMRKDVLRMKENNINAVRLDGYPAAGYFYYLCDQYGLYVVDCANVDDGGMLSKTQVNKYGKNSLEQRVAAMVQSNKNHPSIIAWNLGGNFEKCGSVFEPLAQYVHQYDVTRPVLYPDCGSGSDLKVEASMTLKQVQKAAKRQKGRSLLVLSYADSLGNGLANCAGYWEAFRSNDALLGGFISSFADEGLVVSSLAQGQNQKLRTANDILADLKKSACADGLFTAQRQAKPAAAEVKRVYQDFAFAWENEDYRSIKITNHSAFTNLNQYEASWQVAKDGQAVAGGTFRAADLDVPPGEEKTVAIPYTLESMEPGAEYFLNLSFARRQIVSGGQTVVSAAAGQLTIANHQESPRLSLKEVEQVHVNETDESYVVSGREFTAQVNKMTGLLSSYQAAGEELLMEGLQVNFYRAPKETADQEGTADKWLEAGGQAELQDSLAVKHLSLEGQTRGVQATAHLKWEKIKSKMTVMTRIYGNGEVHMEVEFQPKGETGLNRVGFTAVLPQKYHQATYFGKGPGDTYSDRNTGSDVGLYTFLAEENFMGYSKVQDIGNKTQVRFFALSSEKEKQGLLFAGTDKTSLSCSATNFLPQVMTRPDWTDVPKNNVVVAIDGLSGGTGNRLGEVLPENAVRAKGTQKFSFVMKPYSQGEDLFYLARTTVEY